MMIEQMWLYAKETILGVTHNFGTEILATIVGGSVVWLIGLLPPKYQLSKRLNFAVRIREVVGKIHVSIRRQELLSGEELRNELSNFFRTANTTEMLLKQDSLLFKSNDTKLSYELSFSKDEDTGKNFVSIKCFNIFEVGLFGKVKKFEESVDEINFLTENLNSGGEQELITCYIHVDWRKAALNKRRTKTECAEKNFTATYTRNDLKIVNKGSAYLVKNVKRVFYDWLICSV